MESLQRTVLELSTANQNLVSQLEAAQQQQQQQQEHAQHHADPAEVAQLEEDLSQAQARVAQLTKAHREAVQQAAAAEVGVNLIVAA